MASPPPTSPLDHEAAPSSEPAVMSSSPAPAPSIGNSTRPRRPPTVTPNTFRRFFTPRPYPTTSNRLLFGRRPLREITRRANNRNGAAGHQNTGAVNPFPDIGSNEAQNGSSGNSVGGVVVGGGEGGSGGGRRKRRKTSHMPGSGLHTPPVSVTQTPARPTTATTSHDTHTTTQLSPFATQDTTLQQLSDQESDESEESDDMAPKIREISRLNEEDGSVGLLHRELGVHMSNSAPPVERPGWYESRKFYSTKYDRHMFGRPDGQRADIPFCVAACNTNSVVAVGDEGGQIRLLETDRRSTKHKFTRAICKLQPHNNALIDLEFSKDDLFLATASGDKTARIIDMPTRVSVRTLTGHEASVKQVRFQPGVGNNNIVATSSRDGSVRIWDLRCAKPATGDQVPQLHLEVPTPDDPLVRPIPIKYLQAKKELPQAHANRWPTGTTITSTGSHQAFVASAGPYPPPIPRKGKVSVTSLAFLPPGREHLFLTGCEENSSVRLWDIRSIRPKAKPVAITRQPEDHERHRQWGTTSVVVSEDGARFYSLCRDNVVYAHATGHLFGGVSGGGAVPTTATPSETASGTGSGVGAGMGPRPMFGFRHPALEANSFYVKLALRPARAGWAEMLAVGSSSGRAVLIPTDEGRVEYHPNLQPAEWESDDEEEEEGEGEGEHRVGGSVNNGQLANLAEAPSVPLLYKYGTPLVRGHTTEVSAVSWTTGGDLVTVSDDLSARCWSRGEEEEAGWWRDGEGEEGRLSAREYRRLGLADGRRLGCGWASVGRGGWDVEDW
ncbi:MAG: hypothetical protein M1823_002411 [Watsoniomyces obsoletus]|nr:MAG: hypothetical protein M1823_002411 [Watsoniomyces obsoletus]